jgi:signal transduction histidine kinase/CheY-like chemotaxis protein
MQRIRRAPFFIAGSVVLPLLIFFGIQFAFEARDQRRAVESEAIARTERVIVEADGALQRTLGLLDAVAAARPLAGTELRLAYQRLQLIRRLERSWVTARLEDISNGRVLLDLRAPLGTNLAPGGFDPPSGTALALRAFVGNVGGSGPGCPCVLVHRYLRAMDGSPPYLLTVALDTRPFLRLLAQQTRRGRVGGLVDGNGNFVARTLDHRRRVGTPATRYVQQAIRGAGRGIYESTTWEGFESYTAFSTSQLTGWSAHIAFSTSLIDSPRWQSLAAGLFAGLASLLLALVLIWFSLRQLAQGRLMEARLQEAQKMEALGQITGGIAHDFNNLLTPIVGGLGLLIRRTDIDPSARRMLESAHSAGKRAAKLTGQLLAFSRRQKIEIAPVDLHALLAEIRPLLAQSAGPAIDLSIEVADNARCAATDANQLELALLNLMLNARDAMPRGGTADIFVRAHEVRRGAPGRVIIEVRDTGAGMPPDVLKRATEPFYTTKSAGSGTGLGLAQVYGIVQQSGGTLSIDSEPGKGTTVTISLPACELPATPPPPAGPVVRTAAAAITDEAVRAAPESQGERIVLVDDDDVVRVFVARVLEDAGFIVESVSDGRSAVQLVRSASVALLVVDFAMHGMNGADVVAAARAFRPDLPVLMITGYADTDAVAEQAPGIPVLRKPFEAEALLDAVRTAMAGSKPAEAG